MKTTNLYKFSVSANQKNYTFHVSGENIAIASVQAAKFINSSLPMHSYYDEKIVPVKNINSFEISLVGEIVITE